MTFPPFPPISVLRCREIENDELRMLLEDEKNKSARIIAQRDRLAEASKAFLAMYFRMSSGDCGFWDPNTEKEVFDLQDALAELDKDTKPSDA